MKTKQIYLLDNISSYLYNAFTEKNVLIENKECAFKQIKEGIIIGDPDIEIDNPNVLIYPVYKPKFETSNYHYNSNKSSLTTFLEDYVEKNKLENTIKHYKFLKFFAHLQDQILTSDYTDSNYTLYLRITSYLHLYQFSTEAEHLINYIQGKEKNIPVDNYVLYTNKRITKVSSKPKIVYSNKYKAIVAIVNTDSNMQLIAKRLTKTYPIVLVHNGNFIMLCFKSDFQFKEDFIHLLVDKYTVQGSFTTFMLNNVEPDAIVTALTNML